ncbi:coiled-coil domain-containing protein 114 isoform X2 [Archocentrus centrarchus]|uniref:coiled-coil domain-containing protein 114 isoform X2 n=1 Tax=Archocentrus centrarchus TaxID=63155 RepID=UPI0011EA5169|nr:coiled-coil domain-containing protein 63-like isoform X2 [Archocentrus centrarchus]
MPRGRSATSARSDNSEVDNDRAEKIAKLQRQFKIMGRDLQAYKIRAREQIRKQQQVIDMLQKEQEELDQNLGACKSLFHQQQEKKDIQTLQVLLEQTKMLDEELEKEKQCQQELQKEISSMELKLAELRNGEVSSSNAQRSAVRRTQKAMRTMEDKLDRALTRFNKQLTKNSRLREELYTLHNERVRFQKLHSRLKKELQDVRVKIGEVINQTFATYNERVETQSKVKMIREKAVKDLDQYNAEMKELERVIAHESSLKAFMSIKCKNAGRQEDEHEMGPRQLSEPKELGRMDSGEESLDALQEVFEKIRTATGEDNLDLLVTRFIQGEDRNFALFNFVNEQTNEAEVLKEQISKFKKDMEQFRVEGFQLEQEHQSLIQDTNEQLKEAESHAEAYENRASTISEILDELETGVNRLFCKIECGHSVIEDVLGSSTGITENNIMSYLGLLEQKTNELLTVQAFLNTKDLEEDYNPKPVANLLLGQNPLLLRQNVSNQLAVSSVVRDVEESPVTDEDERPLSQGELRQRIIKWVLEKESSAQQTAQQTDSLQFSGRQHSSEQAEI